MYEFTAEIKKVPDIDGAYIEFPYDLKKNWGKGGLKYTPNLMESLMMEVL